MASLRCHMAQGGVATAGDKAGFSETIRQVGWDAARKDQSLCHRCQTSKVHRRMFSKENLQHLGARHPAISNLTWYESLLVARVHPVISVVTLTSTGLLCYAGHVCNYFQKSFEWFSELPSRTGNHPPHPPCAEQRCPRRGRTFQIQAQNSHLSDSDRCEFCA